MIDDWYRSRKVDPWSHYGGGDGMKGNAEMLLQGAGGAEVMIFLLSTAPEWRR